MPALSIADFTEFLLFNSQNGYYITQNPIGKNADFITAPEISQLFGETLAVYLLHLANNYNEPLTLVEMGAGRGTLFFDLLNTINKLSNKFNINFLAQTKLAIIESSPALQKVQQQKLANFSRYLDIKWYQDFKDFIANNDRPILFVSNELLDCFAINQFVKTAEGWQLRLVEFDGKLAELQKSPHNLTNDLKFILQPTNQKLIFDILGDNLANSAPIGAVFEHSASMSNFFQQLCLAIKAFGGVAINIDYGYCNYDFSNSLQVIVKQQKVPFLKGCLQGDITALVDFNHLGNIAKANQLEFSLINKAKFLLDLGIIQRAQYLLTTNPQQASNIAKDVDRLIGDMGNLFKVMIIWR